MTNIYEKVPTIENEKYLIRLIDIADAEDLQKVYGDKNALPFFNSDNCHGDNFYNPTVEGMEQAIKGWLYAYEIKDFVRLSIVDKEISRVIGTVEVFLRHSEDAFNNIILLRLDLGSAFENKNVIHNILKIVIQPLFRLFDCNTIITKVPIYAVERIEAVKAYGFEKSEEYLNGHIDNYPYKDYWKINRE